MLVERTAKKLEYRSLKMAFEFTLAKDKPFMKSIAVANVIDHFYEQTAEIFMEKVSRVVPPVDKEAFMRCLQNHIMSCLMILRSEEDEELNEYKEELWQTFTGENTEGLGPASLPPRRSGKKSTGSKAPRKSVDGEATEAKKCVLCDSVLETYGNNAAPLAEDGECCDDCNATKVIPARVAWIKADHEKRIAEFNARNA